MIFIRLFGFSNLFKIFVSMFLSIQSNMFYVLSTDRMSCPQAMYAYILIYT